MVVWWYTSADIFSPDTTPPTCGLLVYASASQRVYGERLEVQTLSQRELIFIESNTLPLLSPPRTHTVSLSTRLLKTYIYAIYDKYFNHFIIFPCLRLLIMILIKINRHIPCLLFLNFSQMINIDGILIWTASINYVSFDRVLRCEMSL